MSTCTETGRFFKDHVNNSVDSKKISFFINSQQHVLNQLTPFFFHILPIQL